MTSNTRFWELIQQFLPADRWMKLADLLHTIKNTTQLDEEDLEPASKWQETNLRWERNVRNALQTHLDNGVERSERGYYRLIKLGDRQARTTPEATCLAEEVAENSTYSEGSVQRILVNRYERDVNARADCIDRYGTTCHICGFDFAEMYGEVMAGFIHIHHLKPLAKVGIGYRVDPTTDLRPVCPNCHAVLHRREPPYSIEEVKEFIRLQKPSKALTGTAISAYHGS
jgi:predicted HNH restriction endonuclease